MQPLQIEGALFKFESVWNRSVLRDEYYEMKRQFVWIEMKSSLAMKSEQIRETMPTIVLAVCS